MKNNSFKQANNLLNRAKNFWFTIPQQIRFLIAGGYNTVIGYLIFAATLFILGNKHYQTALFISYILSSFNSYLSQKFLVFQTKSNYIKEYLKANAVWFLGYILNAVMLYLLVGKYKIHPYFAQIVCLITVVLLTYFLLKYYSFRRSEK